MVGMAFKSLVSAVSEQCQEIKQALASFAYFETWDPEVIGECCRVSSVAEFAPDKIILGPDNGNSHTVYFILEGVCKMVQHMHIKVKSRPPRKVSGFHRKNEIFQYKRYRYSDSKTLHSESKNEGYKSRLLNKEDYFHAVNIDVGKEVENPEPANLPAEQLKETVQGTEGETETLVEESEEVNGIAVKESNDQDGGDADNNPPEEQNLEFPEEEVIEILEGHAENNSGEEQNLEFPREEVIEVLEVGGNAENNPPEEQNLEFPEEEAVEVPEVTYEPDHHLKVLEECKKRRNETISVCKKGALPEKLKNVRSVFIQIGFLLRGACFGLEKVENFIMSSTKVKCLKIPQRFLLKHNPCNIWNRIRLFHTLYLPKDERIFQNFRSDRLWTEWKRKLSEDTVSTRNLHNYTLDSDVPYSIRLGIVR